MARVQKVTLGIEHDPVHVTEFHVTVRSTLEFDQEDKGHPFKFRVALFGSDVGEEVTGSQSALYRFRFPKGNLPVLGNDYDAISGVPGTVMREDRVTLKRSVLNEDPDPPPGPYTGPVPLPPGTPQPHVHQFTPDEIYAVASLETLTEARSPVVSVINPPELDWGNT